MKLRWKMLLQLGLTSFLLMVAILLFTLDYTTDALKKIRETGREYASNDLKIRAEASTMNLKNQLVSFYARTESLESLQYRDRKYIENFVRKRICLAEETDTFLMSQYKLDSKNDPVYDHTFSVRYKDGKTFENIDLKHLFAQPDFTAYVQNQKTPGMQKMLLVPGDPGEIWVLYKTLQTNKDTGLIYAVRFNSNYLSGEKDMYRFGYMVFKGEKPVLGSTGCLKNPVTDIVNKEINKLASRVDLQGKSFDSALIRDPKTDAAWAITGTVINVDPDTPDLKMIRIYDYNDVMPTLTQLLNHKTYQIRYYVLWFMLFGLIILVVPMLIFSRQISRPLSMAADFADQLSRGDFSPPHLKAKTGIREVDRMMKALSYLRDQVNSSMERLKRSHTREIEARTDAEGANRLKSDFLDAVSREYKAPLDALTGFGIILNKRVADGQPTDTKELKSILDAISDNLKTLTSMGDILNELKYLNLKAEDLKLAEHDLFCMLHELNAPMARLSRERNMVMEFRYTNEIPYTIYTDRNVMMQMMQMMVYTLCFSTPEKASIFFDCDRKNEMLILSGKSLAPTPAVSEYKRYVSSKDPLRGYKYVQEIIHLTIVKHLIGVLGGTLDIILHPKGGYEFMITFAITDLQAPIGGGHGATDLGIPIPSSAMQTHVESSSTLNEVFAKIHKTRPGTGTPVSVLIGEDDGSHKLLLEIMLRGAGCEVRSADNAQQVRQKITEKIPDIFLLDLHMVEAERCTLLSEIRKMPGTNEMLIFPLFAGLTEREAIRLVSAGADECLNKPLDMEAMTKAVRNAFLIRGNIERTH